MPEQRLHRIELHIEGEKAPRLTKSRAIVGTSKTEDPKKDFSYICKASQKKGPTAQIHAKSNEQFAKFSNTKGVKAMCMFLTESLLHFSCPTADDSYDFRGPIKSPAATLAPALDKSSNLWVTNIFGSLENEGREGSFLHSALSWNTPNKREREDGQLFRISIHREQLDGLNLKLFWNGNEVSGENELRRLSKAFTEKWSGMPNVTHRQSRDDARSSGKRCSAEETEVENVDDLTDFELAIERMNDPELSLQAVGQLPEELKRDLLRAQEESAVVYHKIGRWCFVQRKQRFWDLENERPFWRDMVKQKFTRLENEFIPQDGRYFIADVVPDLDRRAAIKHLHEAGSQIPQVYFQEQEEWKTVSAAADSFPDNAIEKRSEKLSLTDRHIIEIVYKMRSASFPSIIRRWHNVRRKWGAEIQARTGELLASDKWFLQAIKMRTRRSSVGESKRFRSFARSHLPGPVTEAINLVLEE